MPRLTNKTSPGPLPNDFASLVRLYPPSAIRDAVDYENTQAMIDRLVSIPRLTKNQLRYLETLSQLFEKYEEEHYPIETADVTPLDMVRHLMEQHGMNASALGNLLGQRSLGSKVLRGERELSKAHIRKLAEHFGVSPALFL